MNADSLRDTLINIQSNQKIINDEKVKLIINENKNNYEETKNIKIPENILNINKVNNVVDNISLDKNSSNLKDNECDIIDKCTECDLKLSQNNLLDDSLNKNKLESNDSDIDEIDISVLENLYKTLDHDPYNVEFENWKKS